MKKIGTIENYYGGLFVRIEDGKYFWGIENYDDIEWEEIPQSLYDNLITYENTRLKQLNQIE